MTDENRSPLMGLSEICKNNKPKRTSLGRASIVKVIIVNEYYCSFDIISNCRFSQFLPHFRLQATIRKIKSPKC